VDTPLLSFNTDTRTYTDFIDLTGADELLPAMILAVQLAQPPRLHSSITFVRRYSLPREKLASSEAGYLLTHLVSAVQVSLSLGLRVYFSILSVSCFAWGGALDSSSIPQSYSITSLASHITIN